MSSSTASVLTKMDRPGVVSAMTATARLVPPFRVRLWFMASITKTIADDRNLVLKSPTRIWGNRVGKTCRAETESWSPVLRL